MTDNEIVKEVTEAYNQNLDAGCYVGDLLGIINRTKEKERHYRQKAQNQREIINALQDKITRQKAEIERLQAYHDDMESAIYQFREDHAKVKFFKGEIKAEAIKEFAERLHGKAKARQVGDRFVYGITLDDINKTKEEMVGE